MKHLIAMFLVVISMNAFASESPVSDIFDQLKRDNDASNMQNALDRQATALEEIETEMMLNDLTSEHSYQ